MTRQWVARIDIDRAGLDRFGLAVVREARRMLRHEAELWDVDLDSFRFRLEEDERVVVAVATGHESVRAAIRHAFTADIWEGVR